MAEISFYHLTVRPLEWALPKLLERTLESGERALVMLSSEARVDALNAHLWTYDANSWLPHGTAKDGEPTEQPIWLTRDDENSNNAGFLFLADGAASDHVDDFKRVFELFDGRDTDAVGAARVRWKTYKESGHSLSYWQQDDRGRWTKAG
jgi:DNA polymerase III subunit chi